jgi:glucosamine-6-phosphate deaminase
VNCHAYASEAALAAALGRRLVDIVLRNPAIVLGLPTGRTPLALYAELIRLTHEEHVDWSRVRTFNLDEFAGLGFGDPGSYRSFMAERLFDRLNIQPPHIAFLDGRAADLAAECERYERAIAQAGGLDLVILGIGVNGHIGFNEPGPALVARTHVVTLDDRTRAANALWFQGDRERVPRQALTMGMATILNARSIVLIATGAAKSEAVRAMLEGGVTTSVPASFLQLHPQVTVMIDDEVADDLDGCRAISRQ